MSAGRIAVVVVAVASASLAAGVAANHALAIQVIGAASGAIMATGGVALAVWSWPHRRISDLRRLLMSAGFFLACVGAFALFTGAGLYH